MKNKIKSNIVIIVEAIIISIFLVFGKTIENNGRVDFFDSMLYIWIVLFAICNFFIILLLYKNLYKFEKKQLACLELKPKYKYLIIFLIIFLCWIPLFLAIFPGYYCYDATTLYSSFVDGNLTRHHPLLHTILLQSIVHLFYLLTNSYNVGIAIYMIFQMIFASFVFTYSIYFFDKYKVHIGLKIITIIYYACFPVIQMFAMCSSKDTLFSLIAYLLLMCIIDIFYDSKKWFYSSTKIRKLQVFKYVVLIVLFCALRNNAIYAFFIFTFLYLIYLPKETKKQIFIISLMAIVLYKGIIWGICKIGKDYIKDYIEPGEIFSVPIQQLAYVYVNSYDSLTDEERNIINSIITGNVWDKYNPQLSDPLKERFSFENFRFNVKTYILLGIKHPFDYINSFLINTVGYWYPNKVIDGYIKTSIRYTDSKTCYFSAETELPGTRHSFIPFLEKIYWNISREGVVENIPIVSLFFSIGANFIFLLLTIGYCMYKKRYTISVPFALVILLYGTVLLGPIVLVRYVLILFFMFPLTLCVFLNSNRFEK